MSIKTEYRGVTAALLEAPRTCQMCGKETRDGELAAPLLLPTPTAMAEGDTLDLAALLRWRCMPCARFRLARALTDTKRVGSVFDTNIPDRIEWVGDFITILLEMEHPAPCSACHQKRRAAWLFFPAQARAQAAIEQGTLIRIPPILIRFHCMSCAMAKAS